jgi:hypothetical protein
MGCFQGESRENGVMKKRKSRNQKRENQIHLVEVGKEDLAKSRE